MTSSAMEEMSLQISDIQHDIQDVLDTVQNHAGKRKHAPSNTDTPDDVQPTSPTACQPTTGKQQYISLVHSLMHSRHATTAAQEILDVLTLSSSPRAPTQMLTDATNPTPMTTAKPDTSLPAAATAALVSTQESRIVTGKVRQRKAKALFIYLFIYSLIACNLKVMAILQKRKYTKQEG
jgi:hypothetical protein